MGKVTWDLVFINNTKEFYNSLNIRNFIELSMLTKLVRYKLKPEIFQIISINDSIVDTVLTEIYNTNQLSSYKDTSVLDLLVAEYIEDFNRCIQQILPYIKGANLVFESNHYQLLELSLLLPKLSYLSLDSVKISLSAFKTALNNFEDLKKIEINSVNFIQYRGENYSISPIQLPSILQSIMWHCSKVSICKPGYGPQLIDISVYDPKLIEHSDLLIYPDYFPKLKWFYGFSAPISFYQDLLLKNPQLDKLIIRIVEFAEHSAILLHIMHNIKKLKLFIVELSYSINNVILNLPNLTHLKLYKVDQNIWYMLEKLVLSSPNLVELCISIVFNSDPPLANLINNAKSLQSLTICYSNYVKLCFDDLKPHPSLKKFEFWNELDIRSLLMKLNEFQNFKSVIIIKNYFNMNPSLLIHDQDNTPEPWKFIKTGIYYKYHNYC